MGIESFLKKIQKQPENVRKLILWITVIIIGLILASLWLLNIFQKIQKFNKEDFEKALNLPTLQEKIQNQ